MISAEKPIQESFVWPDIALHNDRIATKEGLPDLNLSRILQFIFNERLTLSPRKRWAKRIKLNDKRPGWVHVGLDKRDLIEQQHTKFVRTYETMLDLVTQGYEYMTFGTFRVHRRNSYERNRRNLNSCHAFVLDIDSKKWSTDDILSFCSSVGLVPPSLINETPRGYHVWFVLESDVVGPHETLHAGQRSLTKAGQYYVDINRFLIELFEEAFPSGADAAGVDNTIGGERYIRIPTNVCYFSGNKYSINHFAQLKKEVYQKKPKKSPEKKIQERNGRIFIPHAALKKDPAYVKLLTMQPGVGDRRYTAYTIALLFYACNVDQEQTTRYLKNWFENLQLKDDFRWVEVENAIVSAYSGVKRGPHTKWIFRLTGLKPKIFFTRKLTDDERTYKTLDYWETLFLEQLRSHHGQWTVSIRELCLSMAMKSKAMLEKLIDSLVAKGLVRKIVSGRGRSASTTYELIATTNPEPNKPCPTQPAKKSAVISLAEYRKKMESKTTLLNVPLSYRNLSRSIREGGRGAFWQSDPDDRKDEGGEPGD